MPTRATRRSPRRPTSAERLLLAGRLGLRVQRVDGRAGAARCPAAQAGRADVAGDGEVGEDLRLDLLRHVGVLAQELLGVLAALADALAVEGEPGAALLDRAALGAEVDEVALAADALAVEDVELDLAERRRHLVLHDLHARAVADDLLAVLDRADAADVEAHGRVELERVAAGRRLRVAEHDADLHADLVDEDDQRVRLRDRAGELAQRLAHEARLQADVGVAHLALELGLRRQRRDRVDDDDVDGVRAHQHVGDLERLLAAVRLRDEQVVGPHAELARVADVERVLGVDERADAAPLLRLGDDVQRQRRLAGRLRPVDLDDAAARQPADAERDVEAERAGRDRPSPRAAAIPSPRRMMRPCRTASRSSRPRGRSPSRARDRAVGARRFLVALLPPWSRSSRSSRSWSSPCRVSVCVVSWNSVRPATARRTWSPRHPGGSRRREPLRRSSRRAVGHFARRTRPARRGHRRRAPFARPTVT